MTWWLARQHLRDWRLWPMAPLVVFQLVLDPTLFAVPAFAFLAMQLTIALPAGSSEFELSLPLRDGVATRARTVAALCTVGIVLIAASLVSLLANRPLSLSWTYGAAIIATLIAAVTWYEGAGAWVRTRVWHARVEPSRARDGRTETTSVWLGVPNGGATYPASESSPASFRRVGVWRAWWPVVRQSLSWVALAGTLFAAWIGFSRVSPFMLILWMQVLDASRGKFASLAPLPVAWARLTLLRVGVPAVLWITAYGIGLALPTVVPTVGATQPLQRIWWSDAPITGSTDAFAGDLRRASRRLEAPWRRTTPPLSYWQRTAENTAPVLESSWGERVVADTLSLFGRTLYNPYTVREGSSLQLADWQFERITTRYFGERITRTEYDTRPFEQLPVPVTQRWSVQFLVAGLAFAYALLGLVATEHAHARRDRSGLSRWLPLAVWYTPPAVIYAVRLSGTTRSGTIASPVLEAVALRLADALPTPVTLLVALLPVAAGFALLVWRSRRSEVHAVDQLI